MVAVAWFPMSAIAGIAVDVWRSIRDEPAPSIRGTDKDASANGAYPLPPYATMQRPIKAKEPNTQVCYFCIFGSGLSTKTVIIFLHLLHLYSKQAICVCLLMGKSFC